jgi:putative sugar O-methyltransferase
MAPAINRPPENTLQVEDDIAALDEAMKGLEAADRLYHPGPYWERYREPLEKYLREFGLHNYRLGNAKKKDPKFILNRFGAGEPLVLPPPRLSCQKWNRYRFNLAESFGAIRNAKPLKKLSISTFGNPGDAFRIKENSYSTLALSFYMRYSFLCHFINFDAINTIVEIGPGSGLQTEILHKLHPHLTSYLFDIPPQSYICSQFLKHVMPGKVAGIDDTKEASELPPAKPGHVYIFNSWQVPLMNNPVDLFWNSASFNEMEPNLVENYLGYISPMARHLYLLSIMEGSRVGMENYTRFLPHHKCAHIEAVLLPDGSVSPQYKHSVWSSDPAAPKFAAR